MTPFLPISSAVPKRVELDLAGAQDDLDGGGEQAGIWSHGGDGGRDGRRTS